MSILQKLREAFTRSPPTEEEIESAAESGRIRDAVETTRLSQRSGSAGENYESGRGSSH